MNPSSKIASLRKISWNLAVWLMGLQYCPANTVRHHPTSCGERAHPSDGGKGPAGHQPSSSPSSRARVTA
jgi:hypothetical protein